MSDNKIPMHAILMVSAVIMPFWFKVKPWAGQTEMQFLGLCLLCAVMFFCGYMRWFIGAWRPLLVMIVAWLIRMAIFPILIFVIWFLFLRTEGCWEVNCPRGEPEPVHVIMERFCKEEPNDTRCR